MNKNKSPILRALYIILVPIVILIIILNSGFLQKGLPAARVHGTSYSVTRYNYYYFDYYNRFLEENESRLDELSYDPTVSASSQTCSLENDAITWKEYFQRGGERSMAETAYYCDLAAAAGYTFSEAELRPIREQLEKNAAFQAANYINAKNYYVAYYGSGVTEQLYTAELTRQVKAAAYKTHLAENESVPQAELDAWAAAHSIDSYRTVNLRIITLSAVPDRETGEIGEPQLEALTERLARLLARYQAGESFDSLQTAFSTCALGDRDGVLTEAAAGDLPACLAARFLTMQSDAYIGAVAAEVEDGVGYLAILDGYGGSGAVREAQLAIGGEAVQEAEEAALASDYAVSRIKPGILLATG